MHEMSYEHASAFAREGRFADALAALSTVEARHDNPVVQTLRAELLEHTGAYADAGRLADAIRRSRQGDRALASRCEVVVGHIAQTKGRIEEARQHYRQAIALATAAGDLRQLCWGQLRLLHTMRSRVDDPAVAMLLSDLRAGIARLGDRVLACALHAKVAAAEGERGAHDLALRHVRMAQSALGELPNPWLAASIESLLGLLDYFGGDLSEAHAHAQRALSLAQDSGAVFETASALANLGQVLLARGDYEGATRHFEQALAKAPAGGVLEASLLDGLAHVSLLNGDFVQSKRLLGKIQDLVPAGNESVPYHLRWYQATLVRCALQEGKREEARQIAIRAVEIAAQAPDTKLEALVLPLLVQSCASGIEEARNDAIARAMCFYGESTEAFAEIERVLGVAFAEDGAEAVGASHFRRGIRAMESIGHVSSKSLVLRDYAATFSAASRITAVDSGRDEAGDTGATATPIVEMFAAGTAALNNVSANPELLGREAMELLRVSGCAARLSLVCEMAGEPSVVLASWGQESAAAGKSPVVFRLGRTKAGSFLLFAFCRKELSSLTTCLNIRALVDAAVELRRLRTEAQGANGLWRGEIEELHADDVPGVFVGDKSRELLKLVGRTAGMQITVLITGETGTGKELVARMIHQQSSRAKNAFIPFNCYAVPRDMLDAQLFGHRRGAFTGAVESFQGIVRAANGGVLFLDEVGEIPLELQPKLLRFLESFEVHPIGEPRPVKVDVRVVAATNADLDQLVADKRFREDLFYRLNVLQIRIPPLRERREEIPLMAQYFLERHSAELGKADMRLSAEGLEFLALRDWPGNIRELSNTIRRAVALAANGALLMPEQLYTMKPNTQSEPSLRSTRVAPEISIGLEQPLTAAFQQIERAMIGHAIRRTGGQMEEAARLLGLSRKGLYLKRQRHGVAI